MFFAMAILIVVALGGGVLIGVNWGYKLRQHDRALEDAEKAQISPPVLNEKLIAAIHDTIIEETGNGELAVYVADYLSAGELLSA